jgi:hypothetical protein
MDGGALFKNAIVNQIIDESLKRKQNNAWFQFQLSLGDENRVFSQESITRSLHFQYDDNLDVWIFKSSSGLTEFHVKSNMDLFKYCTKLQDIAYSNNDQEGVFIKFQLLCDDDIVESMDTSNPDGNHSIIQSFLTLARMFTAPPSKKIKI